MKQQINFRASDLTTQQLEQLMDRWGTSQTETLTVVIDRIYQQEGDDQINTCKLQLQAYNAQSSLVVALYKVCENVEDGDPSIAKWQEATRILHTMEQAGYMPQRWGVGPASHCETGNETPEQIDELSDVD